MKLSQIVIRATEFFGNSIIPASDTKYTPPIRSLCLEIPLKMKCHLNVNLSFWPVGFVGEPSTYCLHACIVI
jgi:hypothetical protein